MKRYTIQDLQKFAESKGGRCLSTKYTNHSAIYHWEDSQGNLFHAPWKKILKGQWSPFELKKKLRKSYQGFTIQDLQNFAESKGGKCLSTEYINNKTKYLWEDSKGRQWHSNWSNIQQGTWSPYKYTIQDLHKHAESKGGKCLSKKYTGSDKHYTWCDSVGRTWKAVWTHILRGQWSPYEQRENQRKYTIEDLKEFAHKKGGDCLSTEYTGSGKHYTWVDKSGQSWTATWDKILFKGTWSPYKYTIQDLHKHAESKGGKCLSKKYTGSDKHYTWCDSVGRTWKASWSSVLAGSWSPYEQRENQRKYTIEDLHKHAESKGGKCLSINYKGFEAHHKWQDSEGRKWEATWHNILINGSWSPYERNSKAQLEIFEYIKSIYSGEVTYNDRQVIKPLELDIYVPEKKLAIEFDGLYWHNEKQKPNAKQVNKKKAVLVREKQLNFLAIFEDEWYNLTKQRLIKAMIRHRLGILPKKKFRASKLELKRMDKNKDFKDFFEQFHIDGNSKASFAYGLFDGDIPVVIASFRRSWKEGSLEICRFANNYNYHVFGSLGRILKNLDTNGEKIITFSNNRLSLGKIYESLGFQEITKTHEPSYYYTDFKTRLWRFKCKRINKPEILSEFPSEKAQAEGGVFSKMYLGHDRPLYRFFDFGHRKWILTPKEK